MLFIHLVAALIQAPQTTPDLTIVAPAAPGGGWDQTARVMQYVLRETGIARSVQVVNAPGAAGTIGLARFINSESGNDNALLVTGLVMVSGIVTNRSPATLSDVTPIARLSGEYEVIVVPAGSPFRTLADLVAAFRSNPRAVSWGGGSAGGTDEILVRLLAERLGIAADGVNYIAYSGGGQALASVLGAHVSAAVSGLGEFASQIESGALRALAISSPRRVANPTIPTFHEQGVDLTLLNWRGVVGPPGLSLAERAALGDVVRRMAATPEWKAALARNGWDDIYMDGRAFERFLTDETARVTTVVGKQNAGLRGGSGFERFVLAGFALALAAAAMSAWQRRRRDRPSEPMAAPAINRAAIAMLAAALFLVVALIDVAGFVVAATVMFVLVARAFGSMRLARDTAIGFALALTVHVGFSRGLGVPLPPGRLLDGNLVGTR